MKVEFSVTNECAYSGIFAKSYKKESPYIFVNCNAAPKNIEKTKNNAILYFANKLNAFSPNCSKIVAFSDMLLCGGHFGNVKEYIPKTIAITAAM